MKKRNKIIIIAIVSILVFISIIFGIYNIFKDDNSLSISEKKYINDNKNSVYTINVPNNLNVFGKNGNGVFFDYINDLSSDLSLNINTSVYTSSMDSNNVFGFNVSNNYINSDLLFYTDYYVLVSLNSESVSNLSDIGDKTIGVLSSDLNYISSYYNLVGTIKSFDNYDDMYIALNKSEINYILIQLNYNKDTIIKYQYNIAYFFNDLKLYYYFKLGDDKTLNSIITKHYNNWYNDSFDESYNKNNYNLFITELGISSSQIDELSNKTFTFEYLTSQPYELLSGGKFSGILSNYITSFIDFSGFDFKYVKVRNFSNLKYDLNKTKYDIYFDQFDYDSEYEEININLPINYYLISNRSNHLVIDNIKSYNGTIYVLKDSLLYKYLTTLSNINIKTFDKNSNIKKIVKQGNVVMVDKLTYDNYLIDNISNSKILLSSYIKSTSYTINCKKDDAVFLKLFKSYVNTLNPDLMLSYSISDYYSVYRSGSFALKLAKYIILLVIVFIIIGYLFIRSKKRIVLNTKVKGNDKIKYVDLLTSLKNRNYLNDRLEIWNQNSIHPQAVIVLDLNNIKLLNDTYGHEEGDKQIKACANILFKTQLDNTEILRTDGNEFMVYLVGYNEKSIVNYLKKLNREFKKLPYDYGVAIGYSMINDSKTLIEDAFNEASLSMRKNKDSFGDIDEK